MQRSRLAKTTPVCHRQPEAEGKALAEPPPTRRATAKRQAIPPRHVGPCRISPVIGQHTSHDIFSALFGSTSSLQRVLVLAARAMAETESTSGEQVPQQRWCLFGFFQAGTPDLQSAHNRQTEPQTRTLRALHRSHTLVGRGAAMSSRAYDG